MKTVEKALKILEVFLEKGSEIGISELVNITGQNISTVHAILSDLIKGGYVQQNYKRGKYSLGLKFISFSETINKITTLKAIIHPFLAELNQITQETITALILNRNTTSIITGVDSSHILRVVHDGKTRIPLYCTGAGKIFLAGMTKDELEDYFKNTELIAHTASTITDVDELKKQIDQVRDKQIAYDYGEFIIGIQNIAVPIRNYDEKALAVISLVAPSVRMSRKRMKDLSPLMKKTAFEIEKIMGIRNNQNAPK